MPDAVEPGPTALLSLQEWLKVLSSRGVNMRVAMGLAGKMYVIGIPTLKTLREGHSQAECC